MKWNATDTVVEKHNAQAQAKQGCTGVVPPSGWPPRRVRAATARAPVERHARWRIARAVEPAIAGWVANLAVSLTLMPRYRNQSVGGRF